MCRGIPQTLLLLNMPPIEDTVAGSPGGGPAQETDFKTTQLVGSFFSKRKTCLSKHTSHEKPDSARDMPRHIRLNSVSRLPSRSHGTRMKYHADLRHKLATQVKESTRMVNHSTQTFEDPFKKNGFFHWKEVDSQKVGVPMDCCQTSPGLSDSGECKTSEEQYTGHPTTPDDTPGSQG
ncbi:hypothetical protein JTB14_014708 [Gonioctena quinquepunctata]|nr:hypothetical protein JTB14_014708 [Gonioctena quinquepunctata]